MKRIASVLLFGAAALPAMLSAQKITLDKPAGLYDSSKDKEIVFTVDTEGKNVCADLIKPCGKVEAVLVEPGAKTFKVTAPAVIGWTQLKVRQVDQKGRGIGRFIHAGALTDPYAIKAGAEDPADFDAFWAAELKKMSAVPMNPELKPVEVADKRIKAWTFKLDCGDGNFATGYLSMPADAKEKSLPAIAQFRGASTYGLPKVSTYYAYHSLYVVMSPHPTECGREPEYYKEYVKSVSGYPKKDADNRDKYFMKGMILRVVRTLEFMRNRPEWDGKTLVTHGESQGGFQSIVGAALDQNVTFCLAMVPAMSDHLAYKKGHINGWPKVLTMKDGKPVDNEFNQKADKVLPYFDNAIFAKRIKCPIWISTGLLDSTCPPAGVLAVYNNLPDGIDKHMVIEPLKGHNAGCAPVVDTLHSIILPPPEEK